MRLNESSSREEILNHIKIYPFNFLNNFSDKPWAQPYIDEAAKGAVKEDSIDFLHYFSDKSWAKPYIDDAAKEAAKKDPKYYLKHLVDRFPQGINLALFALGGKNVSK